MEKITCPFGCGTAIIDLAGDKQPLAATMPPACDFQFKQHRVDAPLAFIPVADVWDFSNVGVSRPAGLDLALEVEGHANALPVDKFLTCGECDKGPIGFVSSTLYFLAY